MSASNLKTQSHEVPEDICKLTQEVTVVHNAAFHVFHNSKVSEPQVLKTILSVAALLSMMVWFPVSSAFNSNTDAQFELILTVEIADLNTSKPLHSPNTGIAIHSPASCAPVIVKASTALVLSVIALDV